MTQGYLELSVLAEMYADIQDFRKATENKLRSATVDLAFIGAEIPHYKATEHELSLHLRRTLRRTVPKGVLAWQKANKGVGEHFLARLLGSIGTPRVAEPKHWEGKGKSGKNKRRLVATEPHPRSVSQLWSYCGHGDPERKLHKGMSADEVLAVGNKQIKAAVWNISTSCLKAGVRYFHSDGSEFVGKTATEKLACDTTREKLICKACGEHKDDHLKKAITPYGERYLNRRALTEDRVHASECVRCGPSGTPAPVGSPWGNGHQHADALRILGKEVLRDLWIAAAQ